MNNNKSFALLAIFFLASNIIFGQEERAAHFGIHINPKYTIQIFDEPDLLEKVNAINFSLGLDFYYDITSEFQLRTGLTYFRLDSDQIDFGISFGCDHDGMGGANLENSWIEDRLRVHYIGMPLGIKDKLFGGENYVYLNTAIEVFLKLADSHESVILECGTNEIQFPMGTMFNLQNIYLNSRLGIGYEFGMSKKARLLF